MSIASPKLRTRDFVDDECGPAQILVSPQNEYSIIGGVCISINKQGIRTVHRMEIPSNLYLMRRLMASSTKILYFKSST
ncbi:hypothetical protein AHAS_Ahas18G0049200 [Arachis hypogaea]